MRQRPDRMEARLMLVRGRVQGVNFRRFTASLAKQMNVTGYAKNLPDGASVEVFAEGDAIKLDKLEKALSKGPLGARVDSLESSPLAYDKTYNNFQVL